MSGFPTRPSRTSFGPVVLVNRFPVRRNDREIGADTFMLGWWQLAGLGVVTDLAWASITWDGAAVAVAANGEAWNPGGGYTPPVERVAAGTYRLTYPATANDEAGVAVPVAFRGAKAFPQGSGDRRATAEVTGARVVTVYLRDAAGALVDGSVLVEAK
jgi:hypothetical protein